VHIVSNIYSSIIIGTLRIVFSPVALIIPINFNGISVLDLIINLIGNQGVVGRTISKKMPLHL